MTAERLIMLLSQLPPMTEIEIYDVEHGQYHGFTFDPDENALVLAAP